MTTATKTRPSVVEPIPLRVGMSAEEIYAAYGLTCPPRIGTLRHPGRPTYGRGVARAAAKLGQPFMPWQRYAADVAMEVDPDTGELVYGDVTLLVPRQSGKTTLILAVKVHRATVMGRQAAKHKPSQGRRQRILYTAQKGKDAREKFIDDQLPILEASPYRSQFKIRLAHGSEKLVWRSGCIDGICAPTETAGHSKSLDLGIEDEFWATPDARVAQAFSPAMTTRWSPQHWRISTEGTVTSLYLADQVSIGRTAALAGEQRDLCYLEWSNLDDPWDDPATWWSCMPALGYTQTEAAIRKKKTMGAEEFGRAYLNRRRGKVAPPDTNVPTPEQWGDLVQVHAEPAQPLAFGIELHIDRSAAAIMAVWLDGEIYRWRVIEYHPKVDWVPARAGQLNDRWNPVGWGLALAGPCASLPAPLAEVGIHRTPKGEEPKRGQLVIPNAQEYAGACGTVADRVRNKGLRWEGQQALMDAIKGARSRHVQDGWAWHRRASGDDLSTLVGGTVGMWALDQRKHLALQPAYDPVANIG